MNEAVKEGIQQVHEKVMEMKEGLKILRDGMLVIPSHVCSKISANDSMYS